MAGGNGLVLPEHYLIKLSEHTSITKFLIEIGVDFEGSARYFTTHACFSILCLLGVVFMFPNTLQFIGKYWEGNKKYGLIRQKGWVGLLHWQPNTFWAIVIGLMFCFCMVNLVKQSEFLYFQF